MVKIVDTSKYYIENIVEENIHLIEYFLNNAGNSTYSFRYFSKRPFSAIKNHIITAVILSNQDPIGYGHLDFDSDRVWLGVAISEKFHSKGLGSIMVDYLISNAKINRVENIYLAVDKTNKSAIFLYYKYGFKHTDEDNDTYFIMCLKLKYD